MELSQPNQNLEAITLFDEIKLGDLKLRNRIVMASLTRLKCDHATGVPTDLHVQYYSQRASGASLIITESAPVSHNGQAQFGAGCIYTKEQTEGWKKVVDAVHKEDCHIFIQLWHGGRASHPLLIGEQNIGASPIAIRGVLRSKNVPHETPKEMSLEDIAKVRKEFKQAAENAKEAGFDGVEIQGANGYLIDQFLRNATNQRKDDYGGSIENRSRFCLEIIDDLIEVFGKGRVGIKLSPVGRSMDMFDDNPLELFSYLLKELDKRGIAYVQLMESGQMHSEIKFKIPCHHPPGNEQIENVAKTFRPYFKGLLMTNMRHTPETALETIKAGSADLISFGRLFISNPDLPQRIKNGWPLAAFDDNTFYGGKEKGYTDYPFYSESEEKGV
jgi:2,4-dienoyl-CoA reductase-like NADH-dependent reductase (Old Yellow Enzyme family)